jgi:hypothetical protein
MNERITNRPFLTTPERKCPSCGRDYRAAWGWIITEHGDVVDLDGDCARELRYLPIEVRRERVAIILARIEAGDRRVL